MKKITEYSTIIFDCDGVVLNSNHLKSQAFYDVTVPFGESLAEEMLAYHISNGGVSRNVKFAHFLENIAPRHTIQDHTRSLNSLLANYASKIRFGLQKCEITKGLPKLRASTLGARWMIVSGGNQEEIREVFAARGIVDLFNGGIFGSPDSKPEILARETARGNIQQPAIFLGDSKYDYDCAKEFEVDFVFVNGWTEVNNWKEYVKINGITSVKKVGDLLCI